jgi:hypothetical protein
VLILRLPAYAMFLRSLGVSQRRPGVAESPNCRVPCTAGTLNANNASYAEEHLADETGWKINLRRPGVFYAAV